MYLKTLFVSGVAALALQVSALAAPIMSITVGGSNVLNVPGPAPVVLALEVNLNSDGQDYAGWQHALIASDPALFQYDAPVAQLEPASGLAAGDLLFAPAANTPLGNGFGDEISVFKFSPGDVGPVNGHVETIFISSIAALPLGSYTFQIGDSGQGHFLVEANPSVVNTPFGDPGVFTLNITPEPGSLLMLVAGALPLAMRRRRMA